MSDKTKLWEFLYQEIIEEGGDGDAVVISDNYKKYAQEFDDWQKENIPPALQWVRVDNLEFATVTFFCEQEGIIFCDRLEGKKLPEWQYTRVYLY